MQSCHQESLVDGQIAATHVGPTSIPLLLIHAALQSCHVVDCSEWGSVGGSPLGRGGGVGGGQHCTSSGKTAGTAGASVSELMFPCCVQLSQDLPMPPAAVADAVAHGHLWFWN